MSLIKRMFSSVGNGLGGIVDSFNKTEYKKPIPIEKKEDYECILLHANDGIDIENTIRFTRDSLNITGITYPNYGVEELGLLYRTMIDSRVMKVKINPELVNSREKRLMTLCAYFYGNLLPTELVLIDEKTIEYINYYSSKSIMDSVSRDDLNSFKADKSYYQDSRLLDMFSSIVRQYEDSLRMGKVYPIEFFTYLYARDIGVRINSRDEYYTQEKWICIYMTIYSILFNVSIPGDYIAISNDTATNLFYIENLLNNIEHDENESTETVMGSHLKLVKG